MAAVSLHLGCASLFCLEGANRAEAHVAPKLAARQNTAPGYCTRTCVKSEHNAADYGICNQAARWGRWSGRNSALSGCCPPITSAHVELGDAPSVSASIPQRTTRRDNSHWGKEAMWEGASIILPALSFFLLLPHPQTGRSRNAKTVKLLLVPHLRRKPRLI